MPFDGLRPYLATLERKNLLKWVEREVDRDWEIATVVRMMLVPSIMEILGDANWWFPKWLSWLPRLEIDAPRAADPAGDTVSPAAPTLAHSGGR